MVQERSIPLGVCAYSFPCSCGFAQREGQPVTAQVMDGRGLIDLARRSGLQSVELPLRGMFDDTSVEAIDRLRSDLEAAQLAVVVDTPLVDVEMLQTVLPLAARAGARVVRATLSTILEGARGPLSQWEAHLAEMRQRIIALRPVLAAHDLQLALENHQDATSDDLLMLCEAGAGHVGITLDVANPLAVGEEPLAFAHKIGPWIRNVHLKDYKVWATPEGYRLVRCALGEGVIQFGQLIPLLREVAPDAPLHIELAALYGRHIRLFEDAWWQGFPARDVREVLPTLRVLVQHTQPSTEVWQTPWEQGLAATGVAQYEREQFEQSLRYLETLGV